MLSLHEAQTAMARAILEGPDHVPGGLFAGSARRVMLAFASHANTVSHARLVALEDTFPHTRGLLGEARFNRLSRAFLDGGHAALAALGAIGGEFAPWLAEQEADEAQAVAAFEWAWLESYRAAEADALTMQDLAQLDEAGLLELGIALHPAARRCAANQALTDILELASCDHVLLARPGADIRIFPLGRAENHATALLEEKPRSIGNLFAALAELMDETEILPAIVTLVGAGAVVTREPGQC